MGSALGTSTGCWSLPRGHVLGYCHAVREIVVRLWRSRAGDQGQHAGPVGKPEVFGIVDSRSVADLGRHLVQVQPKDRCCRQLGSRRRPSTTSPPWCHRFDQRGQGCGLLLLVLHDRSPCRIRAARRGRVSPDWGTRWPQAHDDVVVALAVAPAAVWFAAFLREATRAVGGDGSVSRSGEFQRSVINLT